MLTPKQWSSILAIPAALGRIADALESIAASMADKPATHVVEPVAKGAK